MKIKQELEHEIKQMRETIRKRISWQRTPVRTSLIRDEEWTRGCVIGNFCRFFHHRIKMLAICLKEKINKLE